MNLLEQIEEAAIARQEARRRGDKLEAARLTKMIDGLYDQRRRMRVELVHGKHEVILHRARIEVELERIATPRT